MDDNIRYYSSLHALNVAIIGFVMEHGMQFSPAMSKAVKEMGSAIVLESATCEAQFAPELARMLKR